MSTNNQLPEIRVGRTLLGLLSGLSLLAVAVVVSAPDAIASPRGDRQVARRPTGRTIQQNLLPPVTMPAVRPSAASELNRSLAADYQRVQTLPRKVLRRMLRSRQPAARAAALLHLLRHQRLTVPFAEVARLARSRRTRLSTRLLALRAALLEPTARHRVSRLLLRLTHGGDRTIREAAYRALNRLPRDSRPRCRRFAELLRRRGTPPMSMRLVARGFARNCLPYFPRALLRAARHHRISVRLGIAEGLRSHGRLGRPVLARLARDAQRLVRLSARNAIAQSLRAESRHSFSRPKPKSSPTVWPEPDRSPTVALHPPTPWSRAARDVDLLPRCPLP